jgi:3-oxoacyl-[acyl-carrier-protein] synthase III
MTQRDFDDISQNIAESIDDAISTVPRERERRIALIRHSVRRAMVLGYKAARKAVETFAIKDGVR